MESIAARCGSERRLVTDTDLQVATVMLRL